jgi:hypothetical protein
MAALITLLVVVILSITVVRVGGIALTMTGVSKDLAVFQAQSAFSGVGFTTNESESVVKHPVRRRIIRILMLLGNAGITSAIASLILTFYRGSAGDLVLRFGLVVLGLGILWVAFRSRTIDRLLTRTIEAGLKKWTHIDVKDYARLLELNKGYTVSEFEVAESDWLCKQRLQELNLTAEGVLVLGIRRKDGQYLGAPYGQTQILPNDLLVCYGQEAVLKKLASRHRGSAGDEAHDAAMRDHRQTEQHEAHL